jgi:hypothetical protein
LETPERNTETLVSTVQPQPENIFRKKKQELKGTFKVMSQKGIKFTSYWTNEKQEKEE